MSNALQSIPSTPQKGTLTRAQEVRWYRDQLEQETMTIHDVAVALKLNPAQEKFAQFYVSPGEFFGNGREAYAEAHPEIDASTPSGRNTLAVGASRSLSDPIIQLYIGILLEESGASYESAMKGIAEMMNDRSDKKVRLLAHKLYLEATGKLNKTLTIDINHNNQFDYSQLSQEDIDLAIAISEKAKIKTIGS